jgi:hypothetical protein
MEVRGQFHAPAANPPVGKGPRYPFNCLGPRTGLVAVKKIIICSYRESNPGRPVRTQSLYQVSYPGFQYICRWENNCKKILEECVDVEWLQLAQES